MKADSKRRQNQNNKGRPESNNRAKHIPLKQDKGKKAVGNDEQSSSSDSDSEAERREERKSS